MLGPPLYDKGPSAAISKPGEDAIVSKNVQLPGFRRQLRRAHKDLEDMGALEAWEIDPHTDLVMAKRGNAITASQKRYLAKRKRRK
jgi:hypothetical protein